MRIAIHQPNFLPYPGFFQKFLKSDVFVLYDNAQYSKNDFHNRNKIKSENGAQWMTIPVTVHLGQKIAEVTLARNRFISAHISMLNHCYDNAPFYHELKEDLMLIYSALSNNQLNHLVDWNINLLSLLFRKLDPSKKILYACSLQYDKTLKSTDALIAIVKAVGGDTYLSGSGGKNYIDEAKFKDANITLEWQEHKEFIYPQQFGEFVPNLSIIDMIANIGFDETRKLLST